MDNIYSEDDKIADISWFSACCDELIQQYGYKYYVIQFRKIIRMYNSYNDAIDYVEKNNMLGKCSIQMCENDTSKYTSGIMYIWF